MDLLGGALETNWWKLLIILAWTLPWKGAALWRAARRRETAWFVALLVVNSLAVLEILYLFIFSARKRPAPRPTEG